MCMDIGIDQCADLCMSMSTDACTDGDTSMCMDMGTDLCTGMSKGPVLHFFFGSKGDEAVRCDNEKSHSIEAMTDGSPATLRNVSFGACVVCNIILTSG